MKKFGVWLLVIISSFVISHWSLVEGMGGPAPKKGGVMVKEGMFLIDDFESGSLKYPREWWVFDIKKGEIASNKDLNLGDAAVANEIGNYSLVLAGEATNWYAGGCGSYLAKEGQDLSKYSALQLDVYGNGPGSGTLKIELFDDDNRNWQAEQDPAKNYAPIYDDKFISEVRVDWNGWKRVAIPFADFVDDNPKVGDDVWNPQQIGGSGGLLQVQFICIASSDRGRVNYNVDNVALIQ